MTQAGQLPPRADPATDPDADTGAPVLAVPQEVLNEAIPGNIRNAELFLRLMRHVNTYLKVSMRQLL